MACLNPLVWIICTIPCIGLAAQRPTLGPIDTDRPDFTDGTATVPRGHS